MQEKEKPTLATVVELTVDIAAPAELVWRRVTDWSTQGQWMLLTKVTAEGEAGVGQEIAAFTGIGRVGFLDLMRVTQWAPEEFRCEVWHYGKLVRGLGIFQVVPTATGCKFLWREELDLPFGLIGQLGFPIVRPLFLSGIRQSLKRLARSLDGVE